MNKKEALGASLFISYFSMLRDFTQQFKQHLFLGNRDVLKYVVFHQIGTLEQFFS